MVRWVSQRVPGHTLRLEGAPYDEDGRLLTNGWNASPRGAGCGKCSCGALSDVLPSANARKQWHRDHKDRVRRR